MQGRGVEGDLRREVDVGVRAGAGDHEFARGLGDGRGLLAFEQAAAAHHFHFETIGGFHADQSEHFYRGAELAIFEGHGNLTVHGGKALEVAAGQRIFNPSELERFEFSDEAHSRRRVVVLVSVDSYFHFGPYCLSDFFHPIHIVADIAAADSKF